MFRKIIIVTSAVFISMQLLTACCNCPAESEYNQKIEWIDTRLQTGIYDQDSTGIRVFDYAGTDYAERRLALRLRLEGRLIALLKPHDYFGTSAYACKCDERNYRATSQLSALNITTLYGFDAAHPAGSLVTAYFKSPGYDNGKPFLNALTLPDFTNLYVSEPEIPMLLDKLPGSKGPQQFMVELVLSNGIVFRDTTAVLQF